MLHELLHPGFTDEDALLLRVVVADLEPLALSLRDDVLHVVATKCTQDTEEKVPLGQLVGHLLFGWQVLAEERVFHGILVEVLHRDLLVGGNLQSDHLVLFEMQFLVAKDIPHEADLRSLDCWEEHIHFRIIG